MTNKGTGLRKIKQNIKAGKLYRKPKKQEDKKEF